MNEKLDAELCAKYPKLFAERNDPMSETCMCWGFTCGDGWFNILDALCSNIQHHIDYSVKRNKADNDYNMMLIEMHQGNFTKFNEYFKGYSEFSREERKAEMLALDFKEVTPTIEQVVVEQVKEKFGGLRFYYRGGDDTIYGMVRMAESMANRTCEQCGNPGKVREGGWIRTLCDTHATQQEQDYVI